jgi:hypothetical protein
MCTSRGSRAAAACTPLIFRPPALESGCSCCRCWWASPSCALCYLSAAGAGGSESHAQCKASLHAPWHPQPTRHAPSTSAHGSRVCKRPLFVPTDLQHAGTCCGRQLQVLQGHIYADMQCHSTTYCSLAIAQMQLATSALCASIVHSSH